jgi:hypothetical protein
LQLRLFIESRKISRYIISKIKMQSDCVKFNSIVLAYNLIN